MTRIFSYVAAALAMLTFAGCGDVPSGGATLATNTASLKPLAPAPEDKDVPVTPTPLAPSALPPVGSASGAQQPFDISANGQPSNGQSAGGPLGAQPPGDAGRIALSGLAVNRLDQARVHFEVNYAFTAGERNPHLDYVLSLSEKVPDKPASDWPRSLTPLPVGSLARSGTLAGEAPLAGAGMDFRATIFVTWPGVDDRGQPKVLLAPVANLVHTASGAEAGGAPPNSGGGLLQTLFGDTAAPKTPATSGPTNPSNPSPAGGQEQIVIASADLARMSADSIHFDITYSFAQGQPVATNWYTVAIREHAGASAQPLHAETKIEGSTLQGHGHLTGNIQIGGRAASFDIHIIEAASRGGEGRQISDVFEAPIHRDLTGEGKAARMAPAGVGVGAQGKGYGAGIVTTPVAALFAAKESIVFKIQIPQAMKFFEAQNNRKPSSHEEFMEKIIKDNQITLPELPAGEKYIYDPQAGELMYTHPQE